MSSPNTTAECVLSPRAGYISSALLGGVGTALGSAFAGTWGSAFDIVFFCWLGAGIIAIQAVVQVVFAISGGRVGHKKDLPPALLPIVFNTGSERRRLEDALPPGSPWWRSLLAWASWAWSAIYVPVSESLWLAANWGSTDPARLVIRTIGVSASALPLAFDMKAGCAAQLERRLGAWSRHVFEFLHSLATCTLAAIVAAELLLAALHGNLHPAIIAVYCFFLIVWTIAGVMFGTALWHMGDINQILGHYGISLAAGVFVALPSIIMLMEAPTEPGLAIGAYLQCEKENWRKFTAVFP